MKQPFYQPDHPDLRWLIAAIDRNAADDALRRYLTPAVWDVLGYFMKAVIFAAGEEVVSQGTQDQTLYFVESGSVSIHYTDPSKGIRVAMVGPGSVIGEGGFFSGLARNASVLAATECTFWRLTPDAFADLSKRQPATALALAMSLGAILAKRMLDLRQQTAVT